MKWGKFLLGLTLLLISLAGTVCLSEPLLLGDHQIALFDELQSTLGNLESYMTQRLNEIEEEAVTRFSSTMESPNPVGTTQVLSKIEEDLNAALGSYRETANAFVISILSSINLGRRELTTDELSKLLHKLSLILMQERDIRVLMLKLPSEVDAFRWLPPEQRPEIAAVFTRVSGVNLFLNQEQARRAILSGKSFIPADYLEARTNEADIAVLRCRESLGALKFAFH